MVAADFLPLNEKVGKVGWTGVAAAAACVGMRLGVVLEMIDVPRAMSDTCMQVSLWFTCG